jgi:DNA polymerase III subunit alpha
MCKLEELILRAKELGQTSIAITDHGSLFGLWKFQQLCIKHNIKPILGCEFYYDNGFDENLKPKRGHLILLAKDEKGLVNLYKLQETAYVEHFYMKHTITLEDLKNHSEGLVCTSACLANIIPQAIIQGEYSKARSHALELKNIFGDDFYLEIQPNSIMEQHIVNKELAVMSKVMKIPLVATNDIHYVYKDDFDVHEVLLAIGTQKKMDDPKRWKFTTNDFWCKSEEEMRNGFNGLEKEDINMAIHNTCVIADKCNARIIPGKYLPSYPFLDEGETSITTLKRNTWNGFDNKIKSTQLNNLGYINSLNYELDVIADEGYSDYFLIVEDFIKRARDAGIIVGDGRGSGAGSKTCYALNITRVEPEEYGLLFERFLATGREPDIDELMSSLVETLDVKFCEPDYSRVW